MCIRFLFLWLTLAVASADEEKSWPQFRGPTGQGHARAQSLPLKWSEQENIKWKTEIPGQGWSSPVIEGDKIWLTTATEEGKSLRAVAVDRKNGKLLHDVELFRVENPKFKHKLNSYASPSPIVENGRVYFNFGTHGTAALDTSKASVLWKNEALQLDHENGPGSSPALHGDLLIIPCDGTNVQFVAAIHKKTGEVRWKVNRSVSLDHRADQMRKAYSTPLLIEVRGKPQVIIPGAEWVYAYNPLNGEEIWRAHYPGFSNVPRPVFGHGLLYVGTGFGKPELWAFRPDGKGDVSESHVAWKATRQAPAKPSPLLVDGWLFMINDNGIATCLDAKSGKELWQERIKGEHSASPLYAAGRIYFFSQDGPATVIAPSDTFKILAENHLDEGFMASPAVVGRALYLRTKSHLYRIEE